MHVYVFGARMKQMCLTSQADVAMLLRLTIDDSSTTVQHVALGAAVAFAEFSGSPAGGELIEESSAAQARYIEAKHSQT